MDTSSDLIEQEKLRELCNKLQIELEQVNQELHKSTLHLKVQEATLQDLDQDIAMLKKKEKVQQQEHENRLFQAKEVLTNLRASHTKEIVQLECQLSAKMEESVRLQNEIQFYKKKAIIESDTNLNCSGNPEGIVLENEALKQKSEELHTILEEIQQERLALSSPIQESEEQLAEYKIILEIQNEEVAEKTKILEDLKHELNTAREKQEKLKNQPLPSGSQGNSMFTEIEDRRVLLEEVGSAISSNYFRLQEECEQQKKHIVQLHTEWDDLFAKIKTDLENDELDTADEEEKTLRSEIEKIKDSIQSTRMLLNEMPKLITTVPKSDQNKPEFLYYQEFINSKNIKVTEYEKQLLELTTDVCNLASTLSKTQRELNMLEMKKMGLQRKIEEFDENKDLDEKLEICRRYTMYNFPTVRE